MSELNRAFRPDFLWGASTAAHQNEGNNVNSDYWALENIEGSMWEERSGDALDFYHRWKADIDLIKALGLNAFRFGIEWSRVEPNRDHISRAELAHYRRIIDYCFEVGVEPVVTLHHYTSPLWFAQSGGWEADDAIERFGKYITAVTEILDGVTWVATMNEPNMFALMYKMSLPLQHPDPAAYMAQMIAAHQAVAGEAGLNSFSMPSPEPEATALMIRAHEHARSILRAKTQVKVGWTIAVQSLVAREGYEDQLDHYEHIWEGPYLEASRDDDWVGVQAYTSQLVGPKGLEGAPDGAELTQTNWAYRPDALEIAVRRTWEVTGGTTILVTENGIATDDDQRRIDYTSAALKGLQAAVADGIDVRGYLHWTFIDNFEWLHGYRMTFGLVAVDRTTFERFPKPSAYWLGSVAQSNGRDLSTKLDAVESRVGSGQER